MKLWKKELSDFTLRDLAVAYSMYWTWQVVTNGLARNVMRYIDERKAEKEGGRELKPLGAYLINKDGKSERGILLSEYLKDHPDATLDGSEGAEAIRLDEFLKLHPNAKIRPYLTDVNGRDE